MATVPNLSSSAANAQASKNRIPGLCDCSEPSEKSALILYPSLGTPLMLKKGQSKCSIFIVGEKGLRSPAGAGGDIPAHAPNLHVFVDRHLRVYPIEKKDIQTDTTVGTLFGDGKTCDVAKQHLDAWRVGSFDAGALIKDRHGRPFATIAPMAVKVYKDLAGGDIYEVELDLKAAPFKPINGESFMSFAWMVKLNDEGKKLIPGATHAEPQDLMIARFLKEQADKDPYHFRNIHEFDLKKGAPHTANALPPQKSDTADQLKSWHPVKYMPARALKLGHLSDVHVNVRHTALGQSPARVIEGEMVGEAAWNQPVGTKVCNAFDALRQLFRNLASGDGKEKADAVLLTGDLIDFNRNINPAECGKSIGEQWKSFNLLNNIHHKTHGPRLYPRGLDDMLVFSLVRAVYREHKLPVFMTSGNHEAYQVPYGISARVEAGDMENWAFKLGVLETASDPAKLGEIAKATVSASGGALREQAQGTVDKTAGWFKSATGLDPSEAAERAAQRAAKAAPGIARDVAEKLRGIDDDRARSLAKKVESAGQAMDGSELAKHLKELEAASKWTRGKANEGMSRDHNMTVYEACLAYGPTYGQALTGFNFDGGQFDWFYALFTPLADIVVAYGAESDDATGAGALQVIAPMGWGTNENFKNLGEMADDALKKKGIPLGVDRQGAGILPRATESWSTSQFELLTQAQAFKKASGKTLTVASHFTIVSFDEPVPLTSVKDNVDLVRFWPHNSTTGVPNLEAGFNKANVGTCERGLNDYFERYVRAGRQRPKGAAQVDWHFSGHSHRSAVYKAQWSRSGDSDKPCVEIVSARDPGVHGKQTVAPDTQTALIVSSCGGPIGYQNFDGELSAWTGRPPAGSLLDCATGVIQQVSTHRSRVEDGKAYNEKPRLAVALDYLWVMRSLPAKGDIKDPIYLLRHKEGFPTTIDVYMSPQVTKLGCIVGMAIWVFEGGKNAKKEHVRKWTRLSPSWAKHPTDPERAVLSLGGPDLVALNSAMNTGVAGQYKDQSGREGAKYRKVRQAFCEVALQAPAPTKAGDDWGKDMLCDKDAWVFPLEISIADETLSPRSMWQFTRPNGERGEVPDWDFLVEHFEDKGYLAPNDVIVGRASSSKRV